MKILFRNIQIECTVDEFEDMYARGFFNKEHTPESTDPYKGWPTNPHQVVAVYGVTYEFPPNANGEIKYTTLSSLDDLTQFLNKENKKESE